MSVPLLALWWLGQRAWLRHQVRRPRRLLVIVVVIGLLVLRVVTIRQHAPLLGSDTQSPLLLLGSMLFLLSVASGFLQQGPRFAPADVDFLFPAPVSPRGLLLFRLLHLWPAALLSSAFVVLMFGDTVGSPWRVFVGLGALQVTALHLQLLVSILLTRADDAVAKRLRGGARVVLLLVLFAGVFALIAAISEHGGPGAVIAEVARSPAARVLIFPATACADFVAADTAARTLVALLRLALGVAGTFALLMVPEIDFREESIDTTARVARLLAQRRRGETVIDLDGRRVASRTGRATRLFSGAGAILWKNSIVLSRSLRTVVPGILFGLLFVLPALFASRRDVLGVFPAMMAITMATLFGSNAFNFDLRREVERIDSLRALPLPAAAIVLAELVTPWVLSVGLQELLVATVVLTVDVDREWFGALALALPIVTAVLVVIDNLSVFLFAPKPGSADARAGAGSGAGSPAQLLRVLVWFVALLPAAGALLVARLLDARHWVGLTAAAAVELLVAVALFVALVRCFERREFAAGE